MSADRLTWQAARDRSGGDYVTYNIYASRDYPVDWSKAENIIAQRVSRLSVNIPHGGQSLNYAVTAVDRFGNESNPVFSLVATKPLRKINFRELIIGRLKKKGNRH
jgi:hypothetical protein